MYNADFKISPFYNSQCFSFLGAGADNWSELDFFQDFSEVCEGDECLSLSLSLSLILSCHHRLSAVKSAINGDNGGTVRLPTAKSPFQR